MAYVIAAADFWIEGFVQRKRRPKEETKLEES